MILIFQKPIEVKYVIYIYILARTDNVRFIYMIFPLDYFTNASNIKIESLVLPSVGFSLKLKRFRSSVLKDVQRTTKHLNTQ